MLDDAAGQAKAGDDHDAPPGMTELCRRTSHQNGRYRNGSEQLRTPKQL
jgi:hypothetical protein